MEKIFIYDDLFYWVYKTGKRTIYAPCEKLKNIQKSILELIKEHYNLKLSIQKAASIHTNQKWLLKMDIKSFYESVTPEQIKICIKKVYDSLNKPYDPNIIDSTYYYCTVNDKLPTGGVASVHIANMVLCNFNEVLQDYCKKCDIKFSRYMDDLFFSSDDKEDLIKIEQIATELLKENNFILNQDKTKYISRNKRQEVLGIVVNNNNAKIPYDVKREYRAIFYNYIKSVHLEEQCGISTLLLRKYNCHHINGYLAYIKCCDKEYYETIKEYIKKLLKRYKISDQNAEIKSLKKVINK